MMRFGDYKSPVLLQALGDLLLSARSDAKQLAARAFLKASYEVEDASIKASFRAMANGSLEMQTVGANSQKLLKLEDLEKTFRAELDEADRWFADGIELREHEWIARGDNVDAEFDRMYYIDPEVSDRRGTMEKLESDLPFGFANVLLAGGVWLALTATSIKILRARRKSRERASTGLESAEVSDPSGRGG
jgi:hypothetical protein